MPTYVYQCSKCEKVIEVEQRITDAPLTECNCGAQGTLKKLIQPIAVMFKGPGFHVNDYRSDRAPSASACNAEAGEPCATCPNKAD